MAMIWMALAKLTEGAFFLGTSVLVSDALKENSTSNTCRKSG